MDPEYRDMAHFMVKMCAAKAQKNAPVSLGHLFVTVLRLIPPVSWPPAVAAPASAGTVRLPTLQPQRSPEHSAEQALQDENIAVR